MHITFLFPVPRTRGLSTDIVSKSKHSSLTIHKNVLPSLRRVPEQVAKMSLPEVPTAEELTQSTDFKNMIVRNLHKPTNKTGLAGPGRGGECWERWLHQIVDGKVTKKYYRGEKKLWPEE